MRPFSAAPVEHSDWSGTIARHCIFFVRRVAVYRRPGEGSYAGVTNRAITLHEAIPFPPGENMKKMLLIVAAALLVPIVPFVLFGDALEQWVRSWIDPDAEPSTVIAMVVGVLSTDIFLPVPSSFVSTLAGKQLGIVVATLASWTGMTIGAVLGFVLARWCGRPLAERFADGKDLGEMDAASQRYGPTLLVVLRPVPVMAEASVLIVGVNRLAWPNFLWPVMISNLAIALVYSTLGHLANLQAWLVPALVISVAIPAVLTIVARKWLGSSERPDS